MSLYKKIKSLGVEDDTAVTFSFEDGCDVFHFNETHIETAMSNTGIAYSLAEAITQGVLYDKGNEVLEDRGIGHRCVGLIFSCSITEHRSARCRRPGLR